MTEIGVRALFENFVYSFGGKNYLQLTRGPTGARVTMCAAAIVMQVWSRQYRAFLSKISLRVDLLAGYVDDGRQSSEKISPHML